MKVHLHKWHPVAYWPFGECSHEFHLHCINKWLSEKHEPMCPMCKRPWGDMGRGISVRAQPVDDAQRAAMHDLVTLETRRREQLRDQERKAHAQQTQRSRDMEEALRNERKLAQENRAPEPAWRGYNDYEVDVLRAEHEQEQRALRAEIVQQRKEIHALRQAVDERDEAHARLAATNEQLAAQVADLQAQLATYDARTQALHTDVAATKQRNSQLENDLIAAESLRRKLHNQVQELRGNVRVYARVRPPRNDGAQATIRFPDAMLHTQIEVAAQTENAVGAPTVRQHHFAFDHVFGPQASQEDVFAEVADLMQSVLDGYNTTIFAYGQTGSGKTHTLEGGTDDTEASSALSASAGLIPRAMHMLWDVAGRLGAQGWTYTFEAQMLQIYLDHIYDLLGTPASDKEKHEVRHTEHHTTITNTVTVPLNGPQDVFALLARAKKRRQVAATLMNERSSRSHSVFLLRVRGHNTTTNETSDATLNLVDLAGSERLATSGSANDPTRLKEAQSINKSLSALADVIGALGGETLCSLRFASKVHATHVGTARAIKGSSDA
ncbi:kinesin-like nuclear fusion protein [Malassezia brasiliensis]|uniref:Kinesin-like protein n=1 Tax=Malassezia brasiliensis TaxID=1821822 RepID=A0AAF0IPL3_9BASI|nr:kinesin-like nuclear fusion protein [Malassezia brasiliensis]